MKTTKSILFAYLMMFSLNFGQNQDLDTEKSFKHSINFCPVALAFGFYSVNYEYMISDHDGLVFRVDYESVPNTYSDAEINVDGKAAILNYRYHIDGKLESCYLGAFGRYRIYQGAGTLNSQTFDFDISEFTIGLNAGKKWVWDSGFNINFTLGYGYTFDDKTVSISTPAIESSIKVFEKDYDFNSGFFGELSIGYAF